MARRSQIRARRAPALAVGSLAGRRNDAAASCPPTSQPKYSEQLDDDRRDLLSDFALLGAFDEKMLATLGREDASADLRWLGGAAVPFYEDGERVLLHPAVRAVHDRADSRGAAAKLAHSAPPPRYELRVSLGAPSN